MSFHIHPSLYSLGSHDSSVAAAAAAAAAAVIILNRCNRCWQLNTSVYVYLSSQGSQSNMLLGGGMTPRKMLAALVACLAAPFPH